MKIAYIVHTFPKLSETFIANEITALSKAGFDISIYALEEPKETIAHSESKALMSKVMYLSWNATRRAKFAHLAFAVKHPKKYLRGFLFAWLRRKSEMWRLFRSAVFWAETIENKGIAHIHAHFASTASDMAMILSMLTGRPFSFTSHAYDIFVGPSFLKEKVRSAKFMVTISEYNKKYLLDLGIGAEPAKIHVIHCGIDLNRFPQKPNAKAGQPLKILTVARLVEKKGLAYLIEALGEINRAVAFDFEYRVIGTGPERKALENLVAHYRLAGKVKFLGERTSEDVLKALNFADVFVLPCVVAPNGDRDGIPVSLMEAMAIGTAVLSTNVSGIPELISSDNGLLIEPGNDKAIYESIMIFEQLSDEKRRKLISQARKTIEKDFNLSIEAGKLAKLFFGS